MTFLRVKPVLLLKVVSLVWFICSGCDKKRDHEADLTYPQIRIANKAVSFLDQSKRALGNGNFGIALNLADSAKHYAPQYAGVYFLRGLIFEKLKRFKQSEAEYEKVLLLNPDYRGVRFNIGNNAFHQGKYRRAIGIYQQELENYSRADVLVNMARAYANLYEVDSAHQALREAILIDSSYANAYMLLGQLYKDDGEIEQGLKYIQRAYDLDPENINYQYFLGSMLSQSGRTEEAVTYLKVAALRSPWHYWTHYSLGQALIRLGRMDEGHHYLARADSLQESHSRIDRLRKQAEVNPGNILNWLRLGSILHTQQRLEEAAMAYKTALYIAPENPVIRENIAHLALVQGDTMEALSHYSAATRSDSTTVNSWFNLGVIYANGGNIQAARNAWQNVLKYNPADTTAIMYLSRLPSSDNK